tara:strand:+ start:3199 stop:4110 length:912 start_codon:yes stop_codon:yes gene_type:complete
MSFLFTCPHCQAKTQVDDRYSGQAGQCAVCGEPIQLPTIASSVDPPTKQSTGIRSLGWLVSACVLLVLLLCLLFAVIRYGGSTLAQLTNSRQRTTSLNNLQQIAEALNAYAADHGTYPPPATVDQNGVPLHSWRVLILPYLGEDRLYNEFDLSLPWNHADNLNVVYQNSPPTALIHPNANANGLSQQSGYHLVVGQGTLFPPSGPLSPDQVTDDPALTLLVIEAAPASSMNMWTEPVELDFGTMLGRINGTAGIEPGGMLDGGAAVATVDGRVHFAKETLSPNIVRSLITPTGSEPLPDDALD